MPPIDPQERLGDAVTAGDFVDRSLCELCGAEDFDSLFAQPFTQPPVLSFLRSYYERRIPEEILEGARYEIAKCHRCRFVWQRYVLNDANLVKLYEEWISAEDSLNKKARGSLDLYMGYASQVASMVRLLDKPPHEIQALDFGMGWGQWCRMANAFGCQAYGVEVSAQRIAYARTMSVQELAESQVAEKKFNFIRLNQVLEHVVRPLDLLRYLEQRLIDSGIVYISVPDGKRVLQSLKSSSLPILKGAAQPLEHINCFTRETLVRMARATGLELVWRPQVLTFKRNVGKQIARQLFGRYVVNTRGTTLYFQKALEVN